MDFLLEFVDELVGLGDETDDLVEVLVVVDEEEIDFLEEEAVLLLMVEEEEEDVEPIAEVDTLREEGGGEE